MLATVHVAILRDRTWQSLLHSIGTCWRRTCGQKWGRSEWGAGRTSPLQTKLWHLETKLGTSHPLAIPWADGLVKNGAETKRAGSNVKNNEITTACAVQVAIILFEKRQTSTTLESHVYLVSSPRRDFPSPCIQSTQTPRAFIGASTSENASALLQIWSITHP